ncbi:Ras small monomeric GTPase [Aspergillus terreus]|uniref:Ras small monomeric GTPase n=1 Tax=Aspergillus terreus TaxID=33178 RepID=A0A5M3ZDK9_ASPTE|nr:hypothetical protein ATETN484_0012045900 [Aspergillus terreus]GFF19697.1 Ras small monomeric GTPase [Aspergillus terreus]
MADDAPNKISVTICGDGGCDMTQQSVRVFRSPPLSNPHTHPLATEDSYSVTRTIDGIPYFLSITDTAGQEEYRGLWTAATLKSDAFLLVYDITNAASLGALDYFMDLIDIEAEQRLEDNDRLRKELGDSAHGLDVGMPPPVKIVAGNKCDLKDARAIAARDGLEYARQHGCGFMETSAREMVNIEETLGAARGGGASIALSERSRDGTRSGGGIVNRENACRGEKSIGRGESERDSTFAGRLAPDVERCATDEG